MTRLCARAINRVFMFQSYKVTSQSQEIDRRKRFTMPNDKEKVSPNKTLLHLMSALFLVWFGALAFALAWPLSVLSIPVLFCYGYICLRILYELTINRRNTPTLASCFRARCVIADLLQRERERANKSLYRILDIGSGGGELARCIAKKIPTAHVTGIEISFLPFTRARLIQRFLGPANLSFERADFWKRDCSDLDAVVLYMGPVTTRRIGEKLYRELKTGSFVISNTYPLLGDWTPIDVLKFRSPFLETCYVYRRD